MKHKIYAFGVCAIAGLFLVFEFTLQVSPSVMTQEFMREFNVDAMVIGAALSCPSGKLVSAAI